MKVSVHQYRKGICHGNIIWDGRWPMAGGKFPEGHPVGGGFNADGQHGDSFSMALFRRRGYWASCFPEGDGVSFVPEHGQAHEQTLADVAECFGWEVGA